MAWTLCGSAIFIFHLLTLNFSANFLFLKTTCTPSINYLIILFLFIYKPQQHIRRKGISYLECPLLMALSVIHTASESEFGTAFQTNVWQISCGTALWTLPLTSKCADKLHVTTAICFSIFGFLSWVRQGLRRQIECNYHNVAACSKGHK